MCLADVHSTTYMHHIVCCMVCLCSYVHVMTDAFSYHLLQIQVSQQMFEARVCPAITMMRPVLSYLQKKDPADIFAEPVSAEDVSVLCMYMCMCLVCVPHACVCTCM